MTPRQEGGVRMRECVVSAFCIWRGEDRYTEAVAAVEGYRD
jgi:hypothetical protein